MVAVDANSTFQKFPNVEIPLVIAGDNKYIYGKQAIECLREGSQDIVGRFFFLYSISPSETTGMYSVNTSNYLSPCPVYSFHSRLIRVTSTHESIDIPLNKYIHHLFDNEVRVRNDTIIITYPYYYKKTKVMDSFRSAVSDYPIYYIDNLTAFYQHKSKSSESKNIFASCKDFYFVAIDDICYYVHATVRNDVLELGTSVVAETSMYHAAQKIADLIIKEEQEFIEAQQLSDIEYDQFYRQLFVLIMNTFTGMVDNITEFSYSLKKEERTIKTLGDQSISKVFCHYANKVIAHVFRDFGTKIDKNLKVFIVGDFSHLVSTSLIKKYLTENFEPLDNTKDSPNVYAFGGALSSDGLELAPIRSSVVQPTSPISTVIVDSTYSTTMQSTYTTVRDYDCFFNKHLSKSIVNYTTRCHELLFFVDLANNQYI